MAGWLLLRSYHEKIEREEHRVDFTGAAVLAIALSALILGALEGGNAWEWLSVPTLVCGVVGVMGLAIFVAVERRASEPIIDLALVQRRVVASTTLVSLGIGALLVGMTSYVPTYLERTAGATPIAAGAAVAAVSIGWPVAASTAGRIYMRWGFRRTMFLGGAIATVGAALTAALSPWPSVIGMAVCAFIIGLGLGYTAAPSLIMAQSSVEWNQRGSVTGLNMFARSAGSAVGVAIYGAIATNLIRAGGGQAFGDLRGQRAREQRRQLGRRHEVAAVFRQHAELACVTGVIAPARRVQGHLHEAVEGQPAAGRRDLGCDALGQRRGAAGYTGFIHSH